MDEDDRRHREEERKRREKRKAKRTSKSESRLEKEAKRKEHIQRTLSLKNKERQRSGGGQPAKKISSKPSSGSSSKISEGGSSKFQALFTNRAEGFMIELNFRNAPPRPPVGPCFVGLGFEGMLNRWTKYRPFNAVETGYSWKLHSEADLGVPLAPAAMDLKCYRDPTENGNSKNSNKRRKLPAGYDDDDPMDDEEQNGKNKGPPPLHPDDDNLINWKGSLGDTAAELLQIQRDRARAEARAQSQGKSIPTPAKNKTSLYKNDRNTPNNHIKNPNNVRKSFEKVSRVLNEAPQPWMMRTTYISNDASRKIHDFTSASTIKKRSAMEVDKKMEETKAKMHNPETIDAGFQRANAKTSKPIRRHPTKRNVTPVLDLPLLPDVDTWGHTFTHVVLDKPPKIDSSSRNSNESTKFSMVDRITKAYITDVEKREQNAKMVCKLLAPEQMDEQHSTNYEVTQTYDLDVVPLKDEKSPHVNFLLIFDEEKQMVRYHPVSSRVQLSTGRPSRPEKSIIEKRTLSEEDVEQMKIMTAEVDMDLEKYLDVVRNDKDDDIDDNGNKGDDDNKPGKDKDDEEDDFDAF